MVYSGENWSHDKKYSITSKLTSYTIKETEYAVKHCAVLFAVVTPYNSTKYKTNLVVQIHLFKLYYALTCDWAPRGRKNQPIYLGQESSGGRREGTPLGLARVLAIILYISLSKNVNKY